MALNAAEAYDKSAPERKEDGHKVIKLLAPKKGSSVLDIGCGTGYHTKALADVVGPKGKVLGFDLNEGRIEYAREKYVADNVEFLVGDAEDIPSHEMFDYIFCNYVIHWCKNKEKVFDEAFRHLAPGGKFGFCIVTNLDLTKVFTPEMVSSDFFQHIKNGVRSAEMSDYLSCATASGFKVLVKEEYECSFAVKDVPQFIRFLQMHAHGKFDESHFFPDVMRQHYGDGEVVFSVPIGICVLAN